ncbi:hypothetical protein LCGC14_0439330 [marine sediment metagenome]|uniref:Uncharacterized protein n=1 Tax=marine sediment metagenome TaxID=412755 RepID=A0A0F9SKX7_9ZZZZ
MENEEKPKTSLVDVDPSSLPEVESQRKDLTDYEKHRLNKAKIESMEIIRIPSKYAKAEDGMVHVLRVIGEVVEVVEVEDNEKNITKIEIRPTELFNLIEDENGDLEGYPKAEDSNWGKLKKAVGGITNPKEIIGKELPMKIVESKGTKFLGFMY